MCKKPSTQVWFWDEVDVKTETHQDPLGQIEPLRDPLNYTGVGQIRDEDPPEVVNYLKSTHR